ncbi:zinc finger protein 517 isoform X1 [Bombina bombina]|uniref:zinc finger protein 517-like isoform X4 n=1 Tax=Bombina bombina TaxID=8345 RepID=UPI00235B0074|nr:zinc finger protein 517-like isoform X4 [Bombina bombina]XP_053578117.1 zinc finger protein 517 isoform X1 [Bombina bombina]
MKNTENILTSENNMATPWERFEFDEVAVYFYKEEWDCLKEKEKELYRNVTMDNYQMLRSLGCVNMKPAVIAMIERGEEPYVRGHEQPQKTNPKRTTKVWSWSALRMAVCACTVARHGCC